MLLVAFAFLGASIIRLGEWLSFLGALIEVAQSLPQVHRDCDIYDWAADTVGTSTIAVLISVFYAANAAGPYRSPELPNGRCRMHGGPSRGPPKGNRNARASSV